LSFVSGSTVINASLIYTGFHDRVNIILRYRRKWSKQRTHNLVQWWRKSWYLRDYWFHYFLIMAPALPVNRYWIVYQHICLKERQFVTKAYSAIKKT